MDADVAVVGAGVAGCAAALGLAARGHQVLLVDRRSFPREKACGEGLMPHGVAALAALGVSASGRPFHGIRYVVGAREAVGRFPADAVGMGVRRRDLDDALVRRCAETGGIAVRTGVRVRGISGGAGARVVETEDGPIRARAVVAADGLLSPIRKALGLDRPGGGRPRFGARRHFRLAAGRSEGDLVQVHVSDGAELYLTPTGPGEMNVALLLEKERVGWLRGDVDGGIDRVVAACPAVAELLDGATPINEGLACGPLRQRAIRGVADGVVLVGDAAGFVDGITGEGMSLSLIGAGIAADVLDAGLRTDRLGADDLARYDAIRRARGRDLTRLTELILWGIRHRWLARRVVGNLGRHPEVFDRVLAVNVDRAPLTSVGLGGVRRLLLGW